MKGGWLLGIPALHDRRAPGNTCLAALRGPAMGTMERRLNGSKGCGGVMRMAPAGLARPGSPGEAFRLGCELAAITHGHPSGFLAAGCFAAIIAAIVAGESLEGAIAAAREILRTYPEHEECLAAIDAAVRLAGRGPATAERVETLG